MPKILICDDELHAENGILDRLRTNGYEIIFASDGYEGFVKLEEEKPDLVIIDINMPDMSGYAFVRHCKGGKETRNTTIIVLAADNQHKELFLKKGVELYITKPFEEKYLFKKVEEFTKK